MAFPITNHNRKNERIGRLRHRINFVQRTTSVDDVGGETHVWVTSDPLWASVEVTPIQSQDDVIGSKITNVTSARIFLRYNSSLEPEDRILFDGNEWEILSILPDSHKSFMQLEAVRYLAENTSSSDATTLVDDEGDALIDDEGDSLLG